MDSDEDNFFDAEGDFFEVNSEGLPSTSHSSAAAVAAPPLGRGSADHKSDATASNLAKILLPVAEALEPFPLHRAAWYGQLELVQRLAAGMTKEQLKAQDSQGNTALHVAVMRRQAEVVSELLAGGSSAVGQNARGWVPLMEAVELGDRKLALELAEAEVGQMRTAVKSKKAALLELLRTELPDFSLQLKWELGSSMPGVGALVRRYAPHDTYTLWKKGGCIRVDGSLMGMDTGGGSVVPAWKRGHFSLLYDATGEKARAIIVSHTDKTFLNTKAARKKLGVSESESRAVETEVQMLMNAEVLQRKKLRSADFRFKPVSGWLTKEVKEKVEGWNCKLYEAAGRLVAVSHYKMPYGLTPDMSFDDYLAATFEPDPVVESPVNLMNPTSYKGQGANAAKAAAKLAVAAKHQRIAAAAAAAKNEEAASVAKAAAARAAAGGLRALAPRIHEQENDDEEEMSPGSDKYDSDGSGGGKERGSRTARKSGSKGVRRIGPAAGVGPEGAKGGRCAGADIAQVVASAEVTQGKVAADGGVGGGPAVAADVNGEKIGEGSDGEDLAALDLTALAAQVAADAAAAQREKRADEGDHYEEDADDDENCDEEGMSLVTWTTKADDATSEGSSWREGGKRWVSAAGPTPSSPPVMDGPAGPSIASKGGAKVRGIGERGAGGSKSGGGQATPSKGWRSWGFGKKDPGSTGGNADGTSGGRNGTTGAGSSGGGTTGTTGTAAKKSRKFTGRCWMAESFPLSLNQLLPLLEVVGTANKVFSRVARFMQKYGDLEMFPVKVQMPLILTVYVLLSFKKFQLLGEGPGCVAAPPDDFFQVPSDYTEDKLEESQPGLATQSSPANQSDAVAAGNTAIALVMEPTVAADDDATSVVNDIDSSGGVGAIR